MTHQTEADHTTAPRAVINLPGLATEMLETARASSAGRAAHTLVPGAGAMLKQTVMALCADTVLADHESPGTATLQVLTGSVRLTGGPEDLELTAGDHAAIPEVRHGLTALQDAVVLISVGQGATPAR